MPFIAALIIKALANESTNTVTMTTIIPNISIPSCWSAANPPPNKIPSGKFTLPEAKANTCSVKKARESVESQFLSVGFLAMFANV